MSRKSKWEYLKTIHARYQKADKATRQQILNEYCQVCGYNRKYAIRLLNGPPPTKSQKHTKTRPPIYGPLVTAVLGVIWEAAGYPWSTRLKALILLWLPWIRDRFQLPAHIEEQLLRISPRTIDYKLKTKKRLLKKSVYGRTKPGTLLKHHIPIKTNHWDVTTPGFTEIDLVSHSGSCAEGEFIHSLNQTDIQTTWVETRAVMGKSQVRVQQALEAMRSVLPFALLGIDSDNGSEFINDHLYRYCKDRNIQFTRGRAYKKDDNAHIEQKNWTHVRKLLGYVRYDSQQALETMNDLYQNELRLLQNLFLPSVKLVKKERVGSRLKRVYDPPQTPLERVLASPKADPQKVAELKHLRDTLNPFELSKTIDKKLERVYQMANLRHSPQSALPMTTPSQMQGAKPLSQAEEDSFKILSETFGIRVYVNTPQKPKPGNP
jgi:transposase InsO family protein